MNENRDADIDALVVKAQYTHNPAVAADMATQAATLCRQARNGLAVEKAAGRDLHAEVERLREELSRERELRQAHVAVAIGEVQRLKEELKVWESLACYHQEQQEIAEAGRAAAQAEGTRLREAVKMVSREWDQTAGLQHQSPRLWEAIERLVALASDPARGKEDAS